MGPLFIQSVSFQVPLSAYACVFFFKKEKFFLKKSKTQ